MADPDDREDHDSGLLDLYRACDWTTPRSWLVLLGLGLALGTISGLLSGMVAVYVFGRPVAPIDRELLADTARMITIALIILFIIWAVFAIWDKRDRESNWSAQRVDSSRGNTIRSILQAAILLSFIATTAVFLSRDLPNGRDPATLVFVIAAVVAVIWGPEPIRACLKRWCSPTRPTAD